MAIKRYTKAELKNLIRTHFQEEVELVPIGNHELRRHQVYRLTMHQKECSKRNRFFKNTSRSI